ncbi:hypothetical protein M569_08282 [Genlisea aurea]|uniref:F-box domain-containing protein n=1 Tax=Genlisea aurea TaxID=192259 RepID=S8CNW1_9LAMI|nr:hypothetical protein M569_08282 [Genlisea aurea]
METLPEDCLTRIISFTSPGDACCSSAVNTVFRAAAESDIVWETFLPSDFPEILARSVDRLEFSSKKELFRRLSSAPLLIDQGKKSFMLDKCSNKICYMLSARELSIPWSSNSLYWSWKPLRFSRFSEAVELRMVCWLEIHGRINTKTLSPNTTYGAYLVIRLTDRAFGLAVEPAEVLVTVGSYESKGFVYIEQNRHKTDEESSSSSGDSKERAIHKRSDGWLEVELGEFYNGHKEEDQVKMWFRETNGVHLKGGLLVEGIELRPKD